MKQNKKCLVSCFDTNNFDSHHFSWNHFPSAQYISKIELKILPLWIASATKQSIQIFYVIGQFKWDVYFSSNKHVWLIHYYSMIKLYILYKEIVSWQIYYYERFVSYFILYVYRVNKKNTQPAITNRSQK